MNNNTGDFIISTAQNIYETFAKKGIKKAVNEEIKSAGIDLVAQTSGLYTAKVTDKALGAANQVLIAADTGAFFAEKIYGTKTVLEKAIELKYLWNVENESKAMLVRDLNVYSQSGTEEDAAKVMNDLYWLKALKLRAITAANDLYKANGDNWLSLVDKSLKETADGVDKIFTNQRDALINASLTENQYTSEPLTLTSGETFNVFSARKNGDGSIVKDGKSTILSKAKARLSGGVDIASGAALNVIGALAEQHISRMLIFPQAENLSLITVKL